MACVFWLLFMVSPVDSLGFGMAAASMIGASVAGPMNAVALMGPRELRHLPITTRDLWRATWIVGAVVPSVLLLVTKLTVALLVTIAGGSGKVSAETMWLSAVYDFAWAGILLPAFPLLGYVANRLSRTGATLAVIAGVLVMAACFALPVAATDLLPARAEDFSFVAVGVLIVGLAIASATFVWTPQRDLVRAAAAKSPASGIRTRGESGDRRIDRLTGLSRVAVPYVLSIFITPFLVAALLGVYGVVGGFGPWWFVPVAPSMIDLSDKGETALTYVLFMPILLVTISSPWAPWIRMLKALPLSLRQLNAIVVLTPVAIWAGLWSIGIACYAIVYGRPTELMLGFTFSLAGIGVFTQASQLRWQGGAARWTPMIGVVVLLNLVPMGVGGHAGARAAFVVIGAIALLAGAALNHHTLLHATSASAAYRRPKPPFGPESA
jgi:hypothetical protein